MTEIRIDSPDGSTDSLRHVESRVVRSQNQRWKATATTTPAEVNDLSLSKGEDELQIYANGSVQFGGVLSDIQRRGDTVKLSAGSYEQLARDAPPTSPKQLYQNAQDSTIVTDAIDAIPGLSAGTIDTIETGIDISYYHASRALQIRRARELSAGEIRYNADKTVDYVQSLGSDKTGTVISPQNQNLVRSPVLDEQGGEQRKTHLRVIGASGASVDVVADSYSGGRERWGRAAFKEVGSTDTLTTLGKRLLDDLANDWQEVQGTLTGLDPSLGDTYTVDYPKLGVSNAELRVVELKTTRDETGTHHKAMLSNRSLARTRALEKSAHQRSGNTRTGQTTSTENIPSVNFPMTEVPVGDFIDQLIFLLPDRALYLWMASSSPTADDATQNTSTCVKVVESPGTSSETELYSQCASSYESGQLLKIEPKTSGRKIAFRLENTDSSSVRASAAFAYTIEKEAAD